MLDRSNQLGNFDRDFPGGRVIVSDEAGLALVPDFVRDSVPNTPFITAAEAGLPKSLRRTDKNNVNPRLGIAWRPFGDSRTVIRGGIGPLHGAASWIRQLLDGRNSDGGGRQFRQHHGRAVCVSANFVGRDGARARCLPARWISVAQTRST